MTIHRNHYAAPPPRAGVDQVQLGYEDGGFPAAASPRSLSTSFGNERALGLVVPQVGGSSPSGRAVFDRGFQRSGAPMLTEPPHGHLLPMVSRPALMGGLLVVACGGDPRSLSSDEATTEASTASEGSEMGQGQSPEREPRAGAEMEPSESSPATELTPEADATADDPRPLPAMDGNYEFIRWDELTNIGTGDALPSPMVIRCVSRSSQYGTEHLLVAIATDAGSNRIVAVDTTNHTFRDHWPLECGDCLAAADSVTTVLADGAKLYATQDFGYRYFKVAEADVGPDAIAASLHVFDQTIWVQGSWGWATAPVAANTELSLLDWPTTVAGVTRGGAVAVTADSVTLFGEDSTDSMSNPCPVPLLAYPLWTALYEDGGAEKHGELDIACANGQLARTDDYPNTPFTIHDLDSPIVWMGEFQIATEHSWYDDFSLERYGYQGSLEVGEEVFGYIDGPRVGMRISSLGIARSILSVALEE